MIISNKINAKINKENIDRDYDIYRLSKEDSKDFFRTNVLDIPSIELKAKSVVYTYGKVWYAMFEKGSIDKEMLKEAINKESPDTRVEKINILEEKIYNNVLLHLILNSICVLEDEIEYSNLAGKLYFMCNNWIRKDKINGDIKSFYCLKLDISKDMYMNMSVQTFSKLSCFSDDKLKSKGKYVFDKKTKSLRKKLKSDEYDENEIYIVKSLNPKRHNTVDFLNFKSFKNFRQCKVGIYDNFINDVERNLGKYISIENGAYENYKTFEDYDKKFENKNYSELLKDKTIIIEDTIQSQKSKELCEKIISELKNTYKLKAIIGSLDKNSYNIRIVHNADFYEENGLKDPYTDVPDNIVVQHRTIESFDSDNEVENEKDIKKILKKESATLTKIIQEIIIKRDILNNKITLVNWDRCNYNTDWTFVKRQKVNLEKKDKEKYIYCKMKISKDGAFTFKYYDDSLEYDLDWEFEYIQDAYKRYKYNSVREVEGLFYKSVDNINTILKTEQTTMPNFKKLKKRLEISDKNKKILVQDIITCLNNFTSDSEVVNNRKEEFLKEIKTFSKYETIDNINKKLKIKTTSGKVLNRYIYKETGILINSELKNSEFRDRYFIPILDIKYFYENSKLYYFVGTEAKKLQQSLNNACLIREVEAEEKIEFEEIMNLLKVEFVKNGQHTVIPFPFKYLNEALMK